jgi:hypothetical protein
LCLTPENFENPWILFEAGAMAKHLGKIPVVPLVINFSINDLRPPLSQLNGALADKEGIFKIVETINKRCSESLDIQKLRRVFEAFWPDMESAINSAKTIIEKEGQVVPPKTEKELLEEILSNLKRPAKIKHNELVKYKLLVKKYEDDFLKAYSTKTKFMII